MLDKVYWLRKSCTRDIVAIVSNNLLFTSLQISDEPEFCLTGDTFLLEVSKTMIAKDSFVPLL